METIPTPYEPLETDLSPLPPRVRRQHNPQPHAASPPIVYGGLGEATRNGHFPTAGWLVLSLSTMTLSLLLAPFEALRPDAIFVFWAGLALFVLSTLVALRRAVEGVVALVESARGRGDVHVGDTLLATLGNLFVTGVGALIGYVVAYVSTVGFSRGRQLRRWGRVLLPRLGRAPAWTTPPVDIGARDVPAGVADQWRENGRTEHASVAAFARLTLDLMALGAPPSLIASTNNDALDEIRHTELCFSVARAMDGSDLGPGPFPEAQRLTTLPRSRPMALAKLAVDSLVDGALHEGVSARIIAKLSQRCEVPAIRAVLKEIAADEGRHAAHGWAVVSWCLAEGGRPVASAVLAAVRALPTQMHSKVPEPASGGEWERFGIHGYILEAEEYAAARSHVVQRVKALAAAPTKRAA